MSKKCVKGYSCGNSCISRTRICRKQPNEVQKQIANQILELGKFSGFEKVESDINRELVKSNWAKGDPNSALKNLGYTPEQIEMTKRSLTQYTDEDYSDFRVTDKEGLDLGFNEEVESVNEFLRKAPKYSGRIFRGISVSKEVGDEILNSLNETGEMKLDAMSSFSRDGRVAQDFTTANPGESKFIFQINQNKSGVAIEDFSSLPDEQEVLVPKNTRYAVKGSFVDLQGINRVLLEEII